MATLSLRIREDLKRKAQELARREGVSLNNYINATLASAVAQAETLAYFVRSMPFKRPSSALQERVLGFMRQTEDPCLEDLQDAKGKRF